MVKTVVHYLCNACGGVQSKWMGKCPDCGAWDSLDRFIEPKVKGSSAPTGLVEIWAGAESGPCELEVAKAIRLPDIKTADIDHHPTGIGELDRVLGGGFVAGSVILLGGDPGIGKSTLLLQVAGNLARRQDRVLYVTSEESAYQTRLRARRLFEDTPGKGTPGKGTPGKGTPGKAEHDQSENVALDELFVLADTNLARIIEQARVVQPRLMVIDSVQMVYKSDLEAAPGSVAQIRRCCIELVYLAKATGMTIVLVGHITKDGQLAGPKLLEHLVDVVLTFEGDRHHSHRVVRGNKNRYGTTLEVGLFEMTGRGLCELTDASSLLDPNAIARAGSVICPAIHGTRCLLLEVQALTATGFLGSAKRRSSGLDANRLAMLIAVLEKHGGLRLADQDVFVSAVGGLKVVEPAADLALSLAIAGAHYSKAIDPGTAVVGEVGLGGEIRSVHQIQQRVLEVKRRGFKRLVLPENLVRTVEETGVELQGVTTIGEVLEILSSGPP